MSKFDIDYSKLTQLLLPIRLRKPLWAEFLNALTKPLRSVYTAFKDNRKSNLYRLHITSQVVYLKKLLNDKYDSIKRGIEIVDGVSFDVTYLFQEEEDKPVYLFTEDENQPVILYKETETYINSADFIIEIPSGVSYNEKELEELVNRYKLANKTFDIKNL
ncbi:MAG: hypothetical protein LC105_06200 [Chitinophagales bacterium]|nr:hypothetical protein [Chitinophagales bacterium]